MNKKLSFIFMKNNSINKKVFYIFIFGLILRLGCVLFLPQIDVNRGDSAKYIALASNITAKHIYSYENDEPDVYFPPGYPFFVSAIYKSFGINNTAVRVVQAVLSALVILFVYYLATEIFNFKVGILSAIITCVYPGFIGYSGLILPQLLVMFLIMLFFFLILRFTLNIKLILVLGLIAGYATLTRAELFLFWPILFLIMAVINKSNKKVIKATMVILIIMSFIVSLWTIRNYMVFGKLMPISIHYGDNFWVSTWKEEWLEWQDKEPFISIVKDLKPTEAAEVFFKAGINNIKEHPYIYLVMCTKRLYRFWLTGHSNIFYPMKDSFQSYLHKKDYLIFSIKLIMLFFNVSIILLGFLGIRTAYINFIQKREFIHYMLFSILFFVILHFFTFATPRYSIPIMPFIIIYSSCMIVSLSSSSSIIREKHL